MCNPGQLCFRAHHNTLQANSGYTPYDTDFDANLHAAASSLPIAPHQLFNTSNDNASVNPHALPSSTSFHTISPMLCSQSDCPWVESGPHLQHDKVFDLNDSTSTSMHMDVGFGDLVQQQLTSPDVNALSQPSTATNFTDFVNGLQPSIQSLPPTSSSSTSIFQHTNTPSISAKPELALNAVNVSLPEPLQSSSVATSGNAYHRKFSTESELGDNHSSTTTSYDSLDGGASIGCHHPLADDQYGSSSASVGPVDFQVPADIEQYQTGSRCNNQNIDKSLYTPLQQQYRQRQQHTKVSSNSSADDNQHMSPLSSPGITITPKLSTRVSTAGSTAAVDGKYAPTRGKKMQYKLKDKARRKCIGDCVETIRSLLHISTLHRTDQASVLLIACDAIQQYQADDKAQKAELKRQNATIRELEARLAKQELELQQAATRCGLPAGHR